MNPGMLRDRITIQEKARTSDGAGGYESSWQDKRDAWAYVKPLRGKEYFESQQIQSEITHKITIRYRKDVSTEDSIVLDNRRYNITSIIDVNNRHRYLEIMCSGGDLVEQ